MRLTAGIMPLLRRPLLGASISILAGVATVAAFAPLSISPLAVLMPALLFLLWQDVSPGNAFWRGFMYGLGLFGAGVSWVTVSIHHHGHAPMPVAFLVMLGLVAFLSLYPAILGYCANRFFPYGNAQRFLMLLPAGWILIEWVRSWVFTGFPWLSLGYSQIDTPLSGFAPLLGVYGLSGLTILTAGGLAYIFLRGRFLLPLAVLLTVWVSGGLLQKVEWTETAGEPFRVSLIQGNIPQEQKWESKNLATTLERYIDMTREQWKPGLQQVQLVVWPETAVPAFYHQVEDQLIPRLRAEALEADSSLLIGIPVLQLPQWNYFNAVVALGKAEPAFYYKRHLVPFGEYLPLRSLVGSLLEFMQLPVADFTSGNGEQALLQVAGYPVALSICYEIIFGEELIESLPQAALLVNISNDAWFGDSLAPHQHLEMTRMRALETGRWLLRATNTGISAIIDDQGELRQVGPQFEVAVIRGKPVPRSGATPYVNYGNKPALLLSLVAFLFVYLGWRTD